MLPKTENPTQAGQVSGLFLIAGSPLTAEAAKKICQDFALKHKLIFDDEGEVGSGRECVGFRDGDKYTTTTHARQAATMSQLLR